MQLTAIVEALVTASEEALGLLAAQGYDAEFDARLEFPFSKKKLDEAILDMEYAIEDWKIENNINEVEEVVAE